MVFGKHIDATVDICCGHIAQCKITLTHESTAS